MKRADFEQLCLACARDLEPGYGDGLVEQVETALWGGARSGNARHMDITVTIADLTGVGTLLVSMVGTAIAFVQMKKTTSRADSSKSAEKGEPAPSPPRISADVEGIERALSEAISDLGREQQAAAKKLAGEICAWMTESSSR